MEINKDSAKARALLQQYLLGKCSKAEEQQVLRWYYSFNTEDDLMLKEGQKEKLLKLTGGKVLSAIGRPKSRGLLFRLKPVMRIAAALLMIVFTGLFVYRQFFWQGQPPKTIYKELATLAGERKMIRLSDGSKIWLNNASKLSYPETFPGGTRTVYLEGEAFFDVAHRENQAFIIRTQKLKVQVLGTTFNVKSFKGESTEEITVASGKVAASKIEESLYLMLLPGDQASYNLKTGNLSKREADVRSSIAWRNNELYFEYETLESICHQLERWYGVQIQCSNQLLLTKRYTLKQKDQSLNTVLKVLSAGDFHYKMNGRVVIIEP